MTNKVINATNAAIALVTSSTSGWTWAKAVDTVTLCFQLSAEETTLVLNARL